MSSLSEKLIKIIDERIEKKLAQTNFVTKYVGIVVGVSSDNATITVTIAGYDTRFTFPNKTGEVLSVGDGVKIECNNGQLTGGYISEKFGKSTISTRARNIYIENREPTAADGQNGDVWIYYQT